MRQAIKKTRIEFIDLMKGICILLVVLNHSKVPFFYLNESLSIFRMPLYFILSGMFFKPYKSISIFGIKKLDSLLVPYFVTWVLYNVIMFWVALKNGTDFYIIRYPRSIWFLLSLFEVNMMYFFIKKINNVYGETIVVMLVSLLGYVLFVKGVHLPYFIDASMSALVFYHIGTFITKTNLVTKTSLKVDFSLLLGLVVVFIALFYLFDISLLNVKRNVYPSNFIVTIVTATTGTFIVFYISKLFNKLPVFSFYGRYSVIVLCFHILYLQLLWSFNVWEGVSEEIQSYIVFGITIVLLVPTIYIVKKVIPFFYSQQPLLMKVYEKLKL